MKTLHQSLIDCDMAMLRAIAEMHGLELSSNRQEEAVVQLAQELLQPEEVALTLESLSPTEREGLEAIIAQGGRIRAPLFLREYGQLRAFGPGRLKREKPWLELANVAEGLWYRGLIYKAFDEAKGYRGEFFFVPQDLLPLLPQAEKGPLAFTVEPSLPPPVIRQGDLAFLDDICTLLSYLQREEVKPLRGGYLPRPVIERLNERLIVKEDLSEIVHEKGTQRLAFLHHLCRQSRLVRVRGGLLKPSSAEARTWLKSSPADQIAALQAAWRDDPQWNELWHVASLKCEDTGWRNDPLATRQRFLKHLSQCPPEQWLSLASFIQAIKESDPDFQRPDGDYSSWYIRQADTGRYFSGFESWDQVEGALIAYFIAQPLHWLGVTSLGYENEADDLPSSFLITPWGTAFLGLPRQEREEWSPQPIEIRSDFTITVPAGGSLYHRFQLERFADRQGSEEGAHLYHVTPDSLARLLREDIKVETVLSFLKQAAAGRLPANVAHTLRQWAQKYGQVSLRPVVLLQVKDELILQELRTLSDQALFTGDHLTYGSYRG
ncbi:MAG: helicase-associated domain-containing protein [Anaerolineae bacterium]